MAWVELIIAAAAVASIGVALLLSALGVISIPDAAYQTLSTLVLALLGTRGRRIGQRRSLRKKYRDLDEAADVDDQDEHSETDEVDDAQS